LPEYFTIIVPSSSPNPDHQAIQSWSEEFKTQLASGGGGGSDGEEEDGAGDGEDDNADEARALLDFAEAIEHRRDGFYSARLLAFIPSALNSRVFDSTPSL
jgi:hypothetical protein